MKKTKKWWLRLFNLFKTKDEEMVHPAGAGTPRGLRGSSLECPRSL